MSLISKYYEKKELVEKLSKELEELGENETLKEELKFKNELLAVIKKYERTLDDAFKALVTEDSSLSAPNVKSRRKSESMPRPLQIYKNPHTGGVVQTRGANHKKLREWREEYGSEAVRSWREA